MPPWPPPPPWSRRPSRRRRSNAGSCAAGPTSWRGRSRWRCSPPSAALWVAEAAGWSSPSFRAFYLFGAILNVPWLALGTVFLLAGRRIGDGVGGASSWPPGSRPASWSPPPRSRAERRAAGRQRALRAAPPHPGRRRLRRRRPRRHRRRCGRRGAWPAAGRRRRTQAVTARRLAFGNVVIALGTLVLSASGTCSGGSGRTPRSRSRSWPASSCCSADSSSPRPGGRPPPSWLASS